MSAVVAYFNTQYVNMINIPDARETTCAGDQNDDFADPLATQKSSVPLQLLFTLTYLISLPKLGNFVNFGNFRHTFAHA